MNFDKLAVEPNPPHGINCHRRGAAALRSDQVPIRQDRGGDHGRPLPVHDEILPLYLELHPDGGRALRGLPRDHAGVRQGEGLRVGPGWRRAVRARLGGVQGCTHPVELLGPLATTAYQTVHPGAPGTSRRWQAIERARIWTAAMRSRATATWCASITRTGTPGRHRSRMPGGQRGARASAGASAVRVSAWISLCMRSPSAANTMRCRSSRLLPANVADTINRRKWLSPCGRAPAWPAWSADSSTRSSSLGASANVSRCRIASATGVGRTCIGCRTA